MRKQLLKRLPVLLVLATACGSESEPAKSSDGLLPCAPSGTWKVSVVADGQTLNSELLEVGLADGGEIQVTFVDRTTPTDQCSPPVDGGFALGTSSAEGQWSESECLLTARWSESYCQSGEQQSRTTTYEIVIQGDSGSGSKLDTYHSVGPTNENSSDVVAERM